MTSRGELKIKGRKGVIYGNGNVLGSNSAGREYIVNHTLGNRYVSLKQDSIVLDLSYDNLRTLIEQKNGGGRWIAFYM